MTRTIYLGYPPIITIRVVYNLMKILPLYEGKKKEEEFIFNVFVIYLSIKSIVKKLKVYEKLLVDKCGCKA